MGNLPESKRPVGSVINVIDILNSRQKTIKLGLATTPSRGTWGFNFSFKKKKKFSDFSWDGDGTFPEPMKSYTVKENHIGSVISEILRFKHTDSDPITFKDILN